MIKPMLAHKFDESRVDFSEPVYIQPKLDGVRCVFTKDGAFSRTGKQFMNVRHIEMALQPLFNTSPHMILDGELYNHKLKHDFEKIISCVRKTKPTDADRAESRRLVQFHCYDIVDETLIFEERNSFIQKHLLFNNYGIRSVDTHEVHAEKYANQLHKIFLDKGYEGSILRLNDLYQCKRSHSLRKFKDFHDAEAVLVDWVEGKGKRKGTIGKFTAIDADGNTFGMPVMDNFKKLQTMFKEMQAWVGKEATFTYFERTKAGSYRHPLFKAIRDYE